MRRIRKHVQRGGASGLAILLVATAMVVFRPGSARAGSEPGAFPVSPGDSPPGQGPGNRSGIPVRTSADPGLRHVVRDDTARLASPAEDATSSNPTILRADAGDDQIGMPGHQVTLNGIRSTPRGQIGYRWIQVGGPRVTLKIEDGYIYTFAPSVPGLYRFVLVVASGREISEPDEVTVAVAAPSALGASGPPALLGSGPESTQDQARRLLNAMRGGSELADRLADSFDFTADRMDLYGSYAEMFGEMSRRLEELVPTEPARRGLWLERVFTPLTSRMVEKMLAEGLDLRRPEGQNAELTQYQRAVLAEQFRAIAEGFRAVNPRSPLNTNAPARADRAAPSGL